MRVTRIHMSADRWLNENPLALSVIPEDTTGRKVSYDSGVEKTARMYGHRAALLRRLTVEIYPNYQGRLN